jgi:hypothetical protein
MTSQMLDYHVLVESSEAFAYSGDKQIVARILPLATVTLTYVLYAVVTGRCKLPRVCVSLKKVEVVEGKTRVVRGREAGPVFPVNFGEVGELSVWVQPRYVLEE